MKRPILALLVTAAASSATLAVLQSEVQARPKVGSSHQHKLHAEVTAGDVVFTIVSDLHTVVKESTDKSVVTATEWKDFQLSADGNDAAVPVEPSTVKLGEKMEVLAVSGGIEGSDPVQFFMVTHFMPPTSPDELKPGDKYSFDVAEVKDKVPAHTYTGEYVGDESLSGWSCRKYKGLLKVKGAEGLTSNTVVWVTSSGLVAKVEADFTKMSVPAVDGLTDGHIVLTLKQ